MHARGLHLHTGGTLTCLVDPPTAYMDATSTVALELQALPPEIQLLVAEAVEHDRERINLGLAAGGRAGLRPGAGREAP